MRTGGKSGALAPTLDDRLIWDTWLAVYRLPIMTVADEVGLFRAVSDQALSTSELAVALGVDARALSIHLGLLAALGFVELRNGRWRATAAVRTWLHPEAEGYAGPILHSFLGHETLHRQLLATLRPDQAAEAHRTAVAEWERGEMPAELAQRITAYMQAHSCAAARAVARDPLFSTIRSVLDVGGGSAVFSIQMAKAHPQLQATVLEIPAVCAEAQGYIARADATQRVRTLAANMFEQAWPEGYDAHFLSNIFHDWSEQTCELLARKSLAALPRGGRILLHEMLMDDDGCGPLPVAAFSVLMLLGTKGRQYSLRELAAILERVGFVDVGAATTGGGYYSLVSATKP